ncbi:SpoIIE family protein phosphatase [Desulfotalea psychrophila]|nr:SpoIIE family protein phosphatase [Desulfotalea psychrophila]
MRINGIAFRLASLTLAFSTLIFAVIIGYNYTVSRGIIEDLAEDRGTLLAASTGQRIAAVLNSMEKVADSIAFSLEDGNLNEKRLQELGTQVLMNNQEIFGTAIAFEPYGFDPEKLYYAPYSFRSQNKISSTNLGRPGYQYFYMDWYQLAKELEKSIWTEPYFDTGGGHQLMSTYSVPFYRKDGKEEVLAGVVTADISLDWMQKLIAEINTNETGYVFLLSRYGTYIAHPNAKVVMNETIFTSAENQGQPLLRDIGRRMVAGESGVEELADLPLTGDSFLYFTSLPEQEWSIGVVFPKQEMFAGVARLTKEVVTLAVLGFVALALLLIYLSCKITRPLRSLTGSVNDIASGNLDVDLPAVVAQDEVGELTGSIITMRDSLKQYIANLTETTAVKERIESELRIAHDIQMSILPKLFPAFPNRSEFDIYASIEPAREVGGDLYDFFFIDENRFCFLVGDVSGKGVPAAFYMAVTKTLLKVVAERGLNPGEILAKVNNDLAEDNDACMFVTLFLAVIDIGTGEVLYANAGHNPPLFIPKGGKAEWIPPLNELVAGAMEDSVYTTKSMTMQPGDTLFIYTDGVTEAMDSKQSLYSDDRLLTEVDRCSGLAAKPFIHAIDDSIKAFTGGAEQSDDITMLAMQFLGKKNI